MATQTTPTAQQKPTPKATGTKRATKSTTKKVTEQSVNEPEITNIPELLMYTQQQLILEKNIKNDYGDFDYYKIDQILNIIKNIMLKQKAFAWFNTQSMQVGDRYYIRATIKIKFNGEEFSEYADIREPTTKPKMDDSQVSRSATTQAKKTLLENLFMISDGYDPDSANNNGYEYMTDSQVEDKRQAQIETVYHIIKTIELKYNATDKQLSNWKERAETDTERVYYEMENFVKGQRLAQQKAQEELAKMEG